MKTGSMLSITKKFASLKVNCLAHVILLTVFLVMINFTD